MKIMIIGLLTLLSFNARSISPDEQLIYMRLLNSSELSEVKLGAKAMHNERPQDQALWDHTAYILWTINTTTDKNNDNFNDTNAWLIRALTEYNNPRYRAMLTQLQKEKQPRKIKRYLKTALKTLPKETENAFNPSQYQINNTGFMISNSTTSITKFKQIQLGSALSHVLSQLSQPDSLGHYQHKYIRMTYIDMGTMIFSYNDGWVLNTKSLQASQSIANVAPQYQALLSQLLSNDPRLTKTAASKAIRLSLSNQAALDHVAQYIWDNKNTKDKYEADSIAWLCKVLGHSHDGRYKTFLEALASSDAHEKIIHYAEGSAEKLPSQANGFVPSHDVNVSTS